MCNTAVFRCVQAVRCSIALNMSAPHLMETVTAILAVHAYRGRNKHLLSGRSKNYCRGSKCWALRSSGAEHSVELFFFFFLHALQKQLNFQSFSVFCLKAEYSPKLWKSGGDYIKAPPDIKKKEGKKERVFSNFILSQKQRGMKRRASFLRSRFVRWRTEWTLY